MAKFESHEMFLNARVTGSPAGNYSTYSDGSLGKGYYDDSEFDAVEGIYLEITGSSVVSGSVDTNYSAVRLWDETNAQAVTNSTISWLSTAVTRQRSVDLKSYFSGKNRVVLHAELATANAEIDARRIALITVINGTPTKFTLWQSCQDKQSTTSTAYASFTYRHQVLFSSGNWNGTVSRYLQATIAMASGGTSVEARLYDGSSQLTEITSTSTTPALVTSNAVTLTDTANHEVQIKRTGGTTAYIYNASIVHKISGSFTKFELMFSLNAFYALHVTPYDWLQRYYQWGYNTTNFANITIAHYFEDCVINLGVAGSRVASAMSADEVRFDENILVWAKATISIRKRTSSLGYIASAEIDFQSNPRYLEAGQYGGCTSRHLIIVTGAGPPGEGFFGINF